MPQVIRQVLFLQKISNTRPIKLIFVIMKCSVKKLFQKQVFDGLSKRKCLPLFLPVIRRVKGYTYSSESV